MKVVVVGAGDVGHYICQILSEDGHSVTLIESSDSISDDVEENLDVRVIRGNGASAKILSIAQVDSCDFFIAMTAHDQLNIVACSLAKKIGAKLAIARVHDQVYGEDSLVNYQEHFNIDVLINPEALTAIELTKIIRNPERAALEDFARGQIELQEIQISENAKVLQTPLKELNLPSELKICYLKRDDKIIVPTANTVLRVGDNITVIAKPQLIQKYRRFFTLSDHSGITRIVINGATETAISIIRHLTNSRFKIRVIEPNLDLCRNLAQNFPNVTVIHGSATSLRLLEEEQIGSADFFISCTKDDEENVMTCLQAKKLGTKNIEMVINKPDYEQVLHNIKTYLNIENIASPRKVSANEIRKYVTNKKYITIGSLRDSDIKIIELKVNQRSPFVNKHIYELSLPPASIIAALMNNAQTKVPSANDLINADDRLIIILQSDNIKSVVEKFCMEE